MFMWSMVWRLLREMISGKGTARHAIPCPTHRIRGPLPLDVQYSMRMCYM